MLQEKGEIGIFYVVDLRSRCRTRCTRLKKREPWAFWAGQSRGDRPGSRTELRRGLALLLSNSAFGMGSLSNLGANGLAYA
jgi:hypothetical protein